MIVLTNEAFMILMLVAVSLTVGLVWSIVSIVTLTQRHAEILHHINTQINVIKEKIKN